VTGGRLAADPLRVLDLGAGMGAMTWGLAAACEEASRCADGGRRIVADWVDENVGAMEVGKDLASAAFPRLDVRTHPRGIFAPQRGRYDVVFLGQVLSEVDLDRTPEERIELHARLVGILIEQHLEKDGSLIVVEPALKDRTRHLHAVRARVLEESARRGTPANVFAPCLHDGSCPALAQSSDWCHEDLPIDLPEWLVPIAKRAGLRWQGLTFSYLVLRVDGASCMDRSSTVAAGSLGWSRVTSNRLVSKGREEVCLCAAEPPGSARRLYRIDREASEANASWDTIHRGDVIGVGTLAKENGRVGPGTRIARASSVPPLRRGLYAIVDLDALAVAELDPLAFADACLLADPAALQLRAKDRDPASVVELAAELRARAARSRVPFVINDSVELALRVDADAVHLGQGDDSIESACARAPELRIGFSTHSLAQLEKALAHPLWYVALGPLFETRTKRDPDPVIGAVERARATTTARAKSRSIVGIGGVTLERAESLAGSFDAVAIIGDLVETARTRGLAALTERARHVNALFRAGSGPSCS
jgi:thiamine-phosphate pyrophosphorylase